MSSFSPDKDKIRKSLKLGGLPTWKPGEFLGLYDKRPPHKSAAPPPGAPGPNDPAVIEARTKALRNAIRNSTRSRTMLADYMGQSATSERKPALGS